MSKRLRKRFVFGLLVPLAVLFVFLQQRRAARSSPLPEVPAEGELLQNGGFEEPGSPLPRGWSRDMQQTGNKGRVAADSQQFHSGHTALKLEPNERNGGDHPLAVAQMVSAGAYRGRRLRFSAYLRATGGASAVLAVLSIVRGKPTNLVGDGEPSGGDWVLHSKEYDVPNDPSVQVLVICGVNGHSGSASFDDVSLTFGDPRAAVDRGARPLAVDIKQAPLAATVQVRASQIVREIPRTLFGTDVEWISNGNMLWDANARRPDPEMLRLTRELGVSLLRFPGGYYADFYHWRNGVGPVEKRPEVLQVAGSSQKSRPDFGTDEALEFAKEVGAELLITVNAGTGTAAEAADWVRYVNGQSLRVRYWEVGNELYINDGSPIAKAVAVDPATYARRFHEFAQAMKAADPRIKVGAIGGQNQGPYSFVHYADWDKVVMERAGADMDFFAVHNAYAPANISDRDDLRAVYRAMFAAPILIGRNLVTVARQISDFIPSRAAQVPVAVTEWGPLFQVDPAGAYAQHTKTLGSALFCAEVLKTLIESKKTEIANFHVLNDLGFMGWISSVDDSFPPRPRWTPTARYYAFQLFSRHFGPLLVESDSQAPAYDTNGLGAVGAVNNVPYFDVVSSLSADRGELYVIGINKHVDSRVEAKIDLSGFVPAPSATAWTLNGTGIDANPGTKPLRGIAWGRQREDPVNPRYSKGSPGEVTLVSSEVNGVKPQFTYTFPAHSVTSLIFKRR